MKQQNLTITEFNKICNEHRIDPDHKDSVLLKGLLGGHIQQIMYEEKIFIDNFIFMYQPFVSWGLSIKVDEEKNEDAGKTLYYIKLEKELNKLKII